MLPIVTVLIAGAASATQVIVRKYIGEKELTLTKKIANWLVLTTVTAIVIMVYSVNMASIVGVFCGGGDTNFAMYLDIFAVWCVAIPLGLLGAFVWKKDI